MEPISEHLDRFVAVEPMYPLFTASCRVCGVRKSCTDLSCDSLGNWGRLLLPALCNRCRREGRGEFLQRPGNKAV